MPATARMGDQEFERLAGRIGKTNILTAEARRAREREEALEAALHNVAEHLVKMKDGAHNCAMCGVLYRETVAALEGK